MALLFDTKGIHDALDQLTDVRCKITYKGRRPPWREKFIILEDEIEKLGKFCDENPEVNGVSIYLKMLYVVAELKDFFRTRQNFTIGSLLDDLLHYLLTDIEQRIEIAQTSNYLHLDEINIK